MASEVDICNIALSHLGDSATVASINPPEGSAQAEHCQRFYPIARDALLEMHDWGFATRRVLLAQLTNANTQWAYCYAQPADLVNTIAVLDSAAADDTSVAIAHYGAWPETPIPGLGVYTPQPFVLESLDAGTDVVYTNQAGALMRYVGRVADTTKFSPLFTKALGWSLASMLAGPVIKGEAGAAMAARCEAIAFGRDGKSGMFGQAAASDANQKRSTTRERHQVSWLVAR
jgi:hypothetical protein